MLKNTLSAVLKSFVGINNEVPVRNMSRIKTRFTVAPFWHPKKTRVLYPENITSDNQEFITKQVEKKYKSPLKANILEKGEWEPRSYRCGLITKKLGVYPMWKKDGTRIQTTLLHVSDNHVVKYIPPEELKEHDHFYVRRVQSKTKAIGALVVGANSADPRLFTKEYSRLFEEAGVMPKERLSKFYITPNARLPIGMELSAAHYKPGDFVDCTGITVDRGFQGVMKRWGFKGLRATHGVTKSHRRGGNIGGGKYAKARVWPGTKMPGHMGRQKRTLRAVEVYKVNTKYNVIWIRSPAIPGEIGNYVILYDTIGGPKMRTEEDKKYFPTYFPEEGEAENLLHKDLHDFSAPSIVYADKKK